MEWTSTYDPNKIGADGPEGKQKLRMSKSSFMLARQCRRKYWWNKVQFPDVWLPPSEAMIRGNVVHKALEKMYDAYDGHTKVDTLFARDEYEDTIDAIISLRQANQQMYTKADARENKQDLIELIKTLKH